MFTIEMLPANHGDCLWIEYGTATHPHRILIDGGPDYAYSVWKERLVARLGHLPPGERHFELLVITHIDADHIGGVLALLRDTSLGITFSDIWFNGWRHLPDTPGELGAVQGEGVTGVILERQLPWNNAFANNAVTIPTTGELPQIMLPGGLELTLLSPTLAALKRLVPKWQKEVERAGLVPGFPPQPAEQIPPSSPGALGGTRLDPQALATLPQKQDRSEANGSSIALLAEFEGRRCLLGADAFAGVLAANVAQLRKQRGEDKLALDAFKIPHHGGQRNLSSALVEQLACRRYLVSTNGRIFNHPDRESVARILCSKAEATNLLFNYRSEDNIIWDTPELKAEYSYATVYPDAGMAGLVVEL